MSTIYSTQDYWTISLSTLDDLGNETLPAGIDVASFKIAFKPPRGATVERDALYNIDTKEVYYTAADDVFLTPAGRWAAWIVIYTTDNRRIPGTPSAFDVSEEGKV